MDVSENLGGTPNLVVFFLDQTFCIEWLENGYNWTIPDCQICNFLGNPFNKVYKKQTS